MGRKIEFQSSLLFDQGRHIKRNFVSLVYFFNQDIYIDAVKTVDRYSFNLFRDGHLFSII